MKSGLEGRNNMYTLYKAADELLVSMKSGLEGRNNLWAEPEGNHDHTVSMKSGLEGRNNGRIEDIYVGMVNEVSMKSGLEGRNNSPIPILKPQKADCLNEVRPRRPEQCVFTADGWKDCNGSQ